MLPGKPHLLLKSHHRMRLIRRLQLVDLFRRKRQIHRLQQVVELFLTRWTDNRRGNARFT